MKTYFDIASDGGSNILEQVTEQHERLKDRLASVRHIVAIASGKGGVGKSTLSTTLANALQQQSCSIGLLDADLNGPSIARMMGVREHTPQAIKGAVAPARSEAGVRIMSMDLFLPTDATPLLWQAPTQQNAYTWRSMVEMSALRELLSDTEWGNLDLLLIDLPPGADRIQNLSDLIPDVSGVIVVTTPAAVAQMVVARSITLTTDIAKVPVIGLIENMASFACPACHHQEDLFPGAPDTKALAANHELDYLGSVPFDTRLARCMDQGQSFLQAWPESPAAESIGALAKRISLLLKL